MGKVTINMVCTAKRLLAGGLIFRECAELFGVNEDTLRGAYNRWEAAEKARDPVVVAAQQDDEPEGDIDTHAAHHKMSARDKCVAQCIGHLLDLRAAYPAGVPIAKGEHARPRLLSFG